MFDNVEIQEGRWPELLDCSKSNISLVLDNILMQGRCSSVFREYWTHWILQHGIAYVTFFVICVYFELSYYVKRRDEAAVWKCQPTKWLNRNALLDGIKHSLIGLLTACTMVSVFTTYLACGGHSTLYFKFDAYSWTWWIVQWPLIYFSQDYVAYWIHRAYHTRFLYKHVHRYHHRYKQPNPWISVAAHPIEIITTLFNQFAPLFAVPIHWLPFATIFFYTYYHSIIQHSGIKFKPAWWQLWTPDVMFHDVHHKNNRGNFGFSCYVWDKINGTMYKSNEQSLKESKDPSIVGQPLANK